MGTIVLYIVLGSNAWIALMYPWIGIVLAYLMAVLTPHNIWWWAFEGVRPLYWVLVPTLAGFVFALLNRKVNFSGINTKLNWCIGIIWITFTISFYFGSYVDVYNEFRFYNPPFMFTTLQKTYLTYFIAVALVDNTKKLKALSLVIIVAVIYMTYWANLQYLVYDKYGRLHGPTPLVGSSIYSDENNFAVLFVIGFPFLFYFGRFLNKRVIEWALWAIILLSWHAIFLTASRGALVGVAAVLMVFAWRFKSKVVGFLIIITFVFVFIWQAGPIMKSRSATIATYSIEASAASRIDAWKAAIGMMIAHPITGVGIASFGQAFPDFSYTAPRIAHNTFFQIGAEYGVVAGITYLVLMLSTLNLLRKNGNRLLEFGGKNQGKFYYCLNEACLLALTGFFVCSLFLSLEKYEVFYYLLILSNGVLVKSDYLTNDKESDF